ncbi:MAG: hypothetical protein KZQ93_06610 [Candidatus Thiodiazotropha sp. (ex Monitilora ramsayi)]|nr:hypothetical protein [Candidatus Thiodiazotropha sp. (ex Monitilora ramsayi)]
MTLDDTTYLDHFQRRDLGPEEFDHLGHLRMAWLHLNHYDFVEANKRVCEGIRDLALKFGAPGKFNYTLTEALMRIMARRMEVTAYRDFGHFLLENRDLLKDTQAVLARHYSEDCLNSRMARSGWVEPDLMPI